MQRHARSCNVMQGHAKSCKVESHTSLVNFTLLSQRFTCIQAFSGGWREVVVYHRCSPELRLVFLCCFSRKQSLFVGHFKDPIFSNISFAQLVKREGAWSKDSDWGHLVLTIGSPQSSGSPFVSDDLCLACRSSRLPLLINLPLSHLAGRNAWPLVYLFDNV